MTKTIMPAQESLQLASPEGGTTNVEKYEFEPIKGYPMLNWRGKRPFTSTQYYPAQLKEVHGEEVDGWRNKIFWGDNLQVMSHLLKEFRGKVDLIYIDPPFDSKMNYKKKIQIKGHPLTNDQNSFEEKQYSDIWNNDEYLQFMYERLLIMRELLSESGSIFLHCDWHKSHYLRCILDEIFGYDNLVNEIIWQRTSAGKSATNNLPKNTDTIYWYSKGNEYIFNNISIPLSEKDIESFGKDDGDGRGPYNTQPIISPNRRENLIYKYTNKEGRTYNSPPNGWRFNIQRMRELEESGRLVFSERGIREKNYLRERSEKGKQISNLWADISGNSTAYSSEAVGYPTQKPELLLERVIKAASKPGGLIFDCFMGSGTTQAVAMRLARRFIGADINFGAIQTTTKRLIRVADNLRQKPLDTDVQASTGFELYNVNHYEIFRNPAQAKELLLEALEIQKLEFGTVFDGEKDGRMVKIMPVNRIATRADLNELVAGFDYKAWERKQNESPNRPVEKITLVCMGHEPELDAQLELAAKPFKIDVEVVDILRDNADLEFKRDSQAKVSIKKGELVIEKFYPMSLLQKLSLQKESVEDWKELVESVLIDWNYDGAVLQPAIVDIPGKSDFVKGVYKVPEDAGTIRVKITDLLSESWEGSISNGD